MNLVSASSPPKTVPVPHESPSTGGARLIYLDALRGLFLVIMAINHIPSTLQKITDHTFGFVSAAEGFVFLAGLMAGLVYTKKYLREGPAASLEASVQRAVTIYRYHVITYFLVFAWVLFLARWHGHAAMDMPAQMEKSPWRAVVTGPLLLFQPTLFDILPMYCGLILLVPILIKAFECGKRTIVLTASLLLWAAVNVFCSQKPLTTEWIQTGVFNFCAWQVLFVVGAAFGHSWARDQTILPSPRAWVVGVFTVLAVLLCALRHAYLPNPFSAETLSWLTNKNNLAPLRLVDVALVFYLTYLLLRCFPQFFSIRPLAFLGRSSIVVFSAHVLVAYFLHAFPWIFAETGSGRWMGTLFIVAALFVAAACDQYFKNRALRPSTPRSPSVGGERKTDA